MPIPVTDEIKAMTKAGIVADSKQIRWTDASGHTMSVQSALTQVVSSKAYLTLDEYEALTDADGNFTGDKDVDYFIVEYDE